MTALSLDERSVARKDPVNRKSYRFQLQGPNARKTMKKVLGTRPPELKFFTMGHLTIAGSGTASGAADAACRDVRQP